MSKVNAEWTGVIELGNQVLDCRLFSVSGKPEPFPLRRVHTKCKTIADLIEELGKGKIEKGVRRMGPTEVREQLFCPKCGIALKTDDTGFAAETDAGLIFLTDAEVESLEFKVTKRVKAEFIDVNDPSINAIGIGRRLYVFPKPASIHTYFNVFHILQKSNTAGFIPELVIKRVMYPAIIRPLSVPEVVFGAIREALVIDVLRDSDTLKDPTDFPDFPKMILPISTSKLAKQITEAKSRVRPLEPARCVNPKRQRLKDLLKRKVKKVLK